MFGNILRQMLAPAPDRLPEPDADLALAALLVRIARADDSYGADEAARIDRVLSRRRGMALTEATALRREAEAMEAEAPDTVRFTRALKDAVDYDYRTGVIEALWEVALADGARDAEEDAIIRLAANLLGVTDRDSALARQRVEARGA
ncbi:tellurite resistance TerB family protein [Frigidibacter sp. MR17.24]|uniref:tellurite resistance TerB family protein n=1 Tax=Frigidibacter sp. MR17.24 TaxID=3127345 RepID=UPI003012AF9F